MESALPPILPKRPWILWSEAKDLDGIVSQMRVTKGVEVAIFMYETDASVYKVSLRSKEKVDVSRIAAYFGGGGHAKAAGFPWRERLMTF